MYKLEITCETGGYGSILALGEELIEGKYFTSEKEAEKYAAGINYKMDEAIREAELDLENGSPYCHYFEVVEPKKFYMHSNTGSVASGEEWNEDITINCDITALIEVELINGDWEEVK